jgi:predicted Zn-ribbon and HTH transcriptional regulator
MTLRFVQTVQNTVQPKVYHLPFSETTSMPTRRETIAELLERADHPLTAQEICEVLDIKKRSIVYEDIEHISKSVKRENKELLIRPAICGKCQFVFKVGKSVKEPSKCPKCKSQWILSPAFMVRCRKK